MFPEETVSIVGNKDSQLTRKDDSANSVGHIDDLNIIPVDKVDASSAKS